MSSSETWSSVRGVVSKTYERQEDQGKIPLVAKLSVLIAFGVSFLYIIIYFIKLGKATTSSNKKGQSQSKTKGVCADKCATPFFDILKSAFITPIILCIVGIAIAAIVIYAKMRSRGFEVAGGKISNLVHSSSHRKAFLVFVSLAFVVWISVSILFYILMGYTNIKFLKVKEYNGHNMDSCLKSGHKWCVHASPEVYWFFMFTIVTFFVLLVVGVSKYVKAGHANDEICAEASMMAKRQFDKIKNVKADAPGTLVALIGQSNEPNDVKQQVLHALESDQNRCVKLRREYASKLQDYQYRYKSPKWEKPTPTQKSKSPRQSGIRSSSPGVPNVSNARTLSSHLLPPAESQDNSQQHYMPPHISPTGELSSSLLAHSLSRSRTPVHETGHEDDDDDTTIHEEDDL